ncbi:hypothetical protein BGW36DRAFT_356981 [Talaromyces proteolyticus]|uniref:Uncharacterized protein n=1 Tax=Talaromyces proteolyticus TaxID=1131652 RepID=A0AAD4KSX0_9EURO|nr:uncharacterized protein BGW36DRAFT_356981 [Talaromyces proteolyticus]KAH8700318.1 hypothetical protein BGW36DRAFT_356981 [Talaromyces proteolyticus]
MTITEIIDAIPESEDTLKIQRNEELLLHIPEPPANMKLWSEKEPLAVAHFSPTYTPKAFTPPKDIYGGDFLRVERQQMSCRQPFYHRNAEVEELSFQVAGERTLMTELGTLELRPGDFSNIPAGIAHDNFGREDIHLLFYVHPPLTECGVVDRAAEAKDIQFDGWKPENVKEIMTECLGAPGCDISISLADEKLLLSLTANDRAKGGDRLHAMKTVGSPGQTEWLYKTSYVWIGALPLVDSTGEVYHRHRRADSIQYQVRGERTIVSQRGTVHLEPGDFISIPRGCAYTSICEGESYHIVVMTNKETPLKSEATKHAKKESMEYVSAARERVQAKVKGC